MAGKSKYKTVLDYINDQPEDAKIILLELREIILEVAPNAAELFNYGVPAFALVEGGKRDEQIMIAGFKNHVGLYPYPTVMEKFSEELKEYKLGKGSVQFPFDKPLPNELIQQMVKFRMKELSAR